MGPSRVEAEEGGDRVEEAGDCVEDAGKRVEEAGGRVEEGGDRVDDGRGRDGEAWRELDAAHRLLRGAARTMDGVAEVEGWPVPFSPVRFLVLARLRAGTPFGVRPRRLARLLALRPSSLAHHLDVLERAELVTRSRPGRYDGRRVEVRLTERGRYAFWRLDSALRRGPLASVPGPPRPVTPSGA